MLFRRLQPLVFALGCVGRPGSHVYTMTRHRKRTTLSPRCLRQPTTKVSKVTGWEVWTLLLGPRRR